MENVKGELKIINADGILLAAEIKTKELLDKQTALIEKQSQKLIDENKDQVKLELMSTLDEYFNRGVDKKKFIDVNRIPLICQDIKGIHDRIEKIDDNIAWVIKIVLGAVILAILGLVLTK